MGRLLAVLAASCHAGRIGEIGTGVGIGAAWMASAMPADCSLVTVEIDQQRAARAARLLSGDRGIRVLTGEARELIPPCAPFGLLFADGGHNNQAGYSALVDLLRVGGQVVMDDVTPQQALPAGSPLRAGDAKRVLLRRFAAGLDRGCPARPAQLTADRGPHRVSCAAGPGASPRPFHDHGHFSALLAEKCP